MMEDRRYLELRLKGEPFCAYPCGGLPDAMWNIYPVRGAGRLGRIMKTIARCRLDRLFLKHTAFPLDDYGVTEEEFLQFVGNCYGSKSASIAFAWPAPVRSENRIYAFVIDWHNAELIGYVKIATNTEEDAKLLREYSVMSDLSVRYKHPLFRFPNVVGMMTFNDKLRAYAYLPLPLDAPRYVRWSIDSWEKDILPIKNELAEGTYRHLSREDVYELNWVKKFMENATRAQLDNLSFALEGGMKVCATHGDMACQNFRYHQGEYWLFDWEEFTMDGPVRADELSFKLSTFVYDMGKTFLEAIPEMPKCEFIAAAAFQVANALSFKKELGELLNRRIV